MQIPVLDVVVLCALKALLHAIFRLDCDAYLISNCCAVLSNVAPHVCDMHHYTSERLVTTIARLAKRVIRAASVESADLTPVHGDVITGATTEPSITHASSMTSLSRYFHGPCFVQ